MVRRLIQKRESQRERQETYIKRSKGLQKKVYELSILCDVDVALIMFSPNGKQNKHYSNQPKIEKVLQEFIQSIPNLPEKEREKFVCLQTSQDIIDYINIAAGPDDVADQQGSDARQREEVNREIIELQSKLMLLQEQEKMLDPTMGTLNSEQEREEHINRLRENALIMIAKRKEELMSRQERYWIPGTNPSLSMQNVNTQLPLQQPQEGMETGIWDPQQGGGQLQVHRVPSVGMGGPFSASFRAPWSPKATVGGMWGPQQRGEQLQVDRVPSVGMGGPSSSSFRAPWPPEATVSGMWGPQQRGKQLQVDRVPSVGMGGPSSSSFWAPRLQEGTVAGMWGPQQGGKQLQAHRVPLVGRGGPSSSSFWVPPSQAGIEDGRWVRPQGREQQLPRGMPERFGVEYLSSSLPSVNALQYSQQPQHGMAFSGGEQPSSNLLSQPGGAPFSNEEIYFLTDLIKKEEEGERDVQGMDVN